MYSRLPRMPRFENMLVHEERHLVAISKPAVRCPCYLRRAS
tara:strand:+ start:288 stop:410 length:123 start_codon:yes stop_codon:yes gene_type:complete